MPHFILILYLLSGFSGLASLMFLIIRYGNRTPVFRAYIRIHFSYTFLMIISLVFLYLRVNVLSSPQVMYNFMVFILAGLGLLSWSLSRYSFAVSHTEFKGRLRIIWTIIPLCYVVLAVILMFMSHSDFFMYPLAFGVVSFIMLSVWFTARNFKREKKTGNVWIIFLVIILLFISGETYLKIRFGFLGEYSLNLPLVFIFWNIISLREIIKKYDNTEKVQPLSFTVTPDLKNRWQLTAREADIISFLLKGDSNKEIAFNLNISFSTVKNHIYNIYKKTGAKSRIELSNLMKQV